ncbi:YciI family protein [Cryobacterium lactosi]|uniref:YciI family protein n=1 Tax=Cryobacterium lactosi TaxID=1259202 RepID=A0A4R9BYI7_9MICO|nr:YciI family protein [Cryobacterium lactosi]TFD94571.1 YciI family protein [Cryobacterium lactosi]
MKYMLIMRATDAARQDYEKADFNEIIEKMGAYNEALLKAGVMLAGDGLADSMADNFVVDFTADPPLVTDGPYGETHELFSGFWMIQVASKEEAIEWASRCPLGPGSKLEVRRVTEMSDFGEFADNPRLMQQETWRVESGQV